MFRVGSEATNEYLDHDSHILSWETTDTDKLVAPIAGWNKFPIRFEDARGYLEVPSNTRNGSSILGGVEAWAGEKQDLVKYLCNYVDIVYKKFGNIDKHAGFDYLGVFVGETAGDQFFIAPPHVFTDKQSDIREWVASTIDDLEVILASDPHQESLVELYKTKISQSLGFEDF
jgi:hypothetical protein